MASMKYTKIWILLNEYNFEVDIQKNHDLICCICKSLLKNAQQSICGCEFCYDCIKNYLATDEKYCPGRGNGCKELMINIERNMQIDHSANKKVANVIVKCPIEFCDFKTELKFMDEHIESHLDDNSNHGKFLREPLEKLKKEMSALRDDLQLYKKDSLGKEMMIMKIRDEIDVLKKMNEVQKMEINRLKEKINKSDDNTNKTTNNMEEDDDIDWQLEIFTDIDGDLNGSKKRRLQESVNFKELVPSKLSQEIRDIISAEVQRQTEDLRKVQKNFQDEIKFLRQILQNSPNSKLKMLETIVVTKIDGDQLELEVDTNKSESNGETANKDVTSKGYVSENKTSRRRIKRDLPQLMTSSSSSASTGQDQTNLDSKPTTTAKIIPESKSNTVSKVVSEKNSVSKAIPVVKPQINTKNQILKSHISTGSSKTIHPAFPKNLNDPNDRRIRIPRNRTQAWNTLATRLERKNRINLNLAKKNEIQGIPSLIDPLHWMRNVAPFELRIDNFAEKRLQSKQGFCSNIFSQPFYSAKNGYKMCLRVDPKGSGFNTHLGVFFCLLRGEHDDHLPWPMKIEVTISLIDQITFLPYTSRTFDFHSAPEQWKYVFNRPMMEDRFWFGTPQFVHFDFLFNNPSLMLNDSILIRCSTGL